ncbi:hypothetical protein HDIA_2291 [Hartmannibacter diazotrophicus]|uniref:Phage protein U n=1 Tax=Hartmannibacter diazotrophicus TaxID=1482074 RepID=A0A2C9D675_9HYPH|nr:hypothetical protein [Hartmannibacter diazotrophicus]SON55832.1 hypothetical protein HDIA_2291 [Hartmannibacter diazotrophicus]
MNALVAIGPAILRVIGMNPQRIASRETGRVIVTPTFGGNDIQLTGSDPKETSIDAETLPQTLGGTDAVTLLTAYQRLQTPVPFIRLSASFLGLVSTGSVIVKELEVDEERLHPRDGLGRIMRMRVTLVHSGDLFGWGLSFL